MQGYVVNKQTDNNYIVEGELSFFSLNKTNIANYDFINSTAAISLDLSAVTVADSAGLALIIDWIKYGKQNNTKLTFKNIPQQLLTLAELSNIEINQLFSQEESSLT